jgi:hypothetical protein
MSVRLKHEYSEPLRALESAHTSVRVCAMLSTANNIQVGIEYITQLQERIADPPELERVKAAWAIYTGHSEITWEEAWQRSEPPKTKGSE